MTAQIVVEYLESLDQDKTHVIPNRNCPDFLEYLRDLATTSVDGTAFFGIDINDILKRHDVWTELLPRIRPFYAVKCNSNPTLCNILRLLGMGFDCSSKIEIQQCLDMGVSSENIIYANPIKEPSMLFFAKNNNVNLMTFDCVEELKKIKKIHPTASLVLRIAVDDRGSVCRFSSKFGAAQSEVAEILYRAAVLNLEVVGVSFHVGSGAKGKNVFRNALHHAKVAFDLGAMYGFSFHILDIGGGFVSNQDDKLFRETAQEINECVEKYFPEECGVQIIAEPGRWFMETSHYYCCSVIGRKNMIPERLVDCVNIESTGQIQFKDLKHEEKCMSFYEPEKPLTEKQKEQEHPSTILYLNDGVYGNFNNILMDHAMVDLENLFPSEDEIENCKVFGPTCDSIDKVLTSVHLPKLEIGDWVVARNMGAYTMSATSNFNGQGVFDLYFIAPSIEKMKT